MLSTTYEKLLFKQVKKVPLVELLKNKNKTPKGKSHAIVEKKSNDILSFCSADYKLRKNSIIFKPFEKLLHTRNILFTKDVRIIEGNKFYVDYVIKKKIKSNIIGDILPKISIWNSYDGTVKTQIKFGYHKLLCGNGLSRPVGCQIHISSKHSADEYEFSKATIPHYISLFKEFLSETKGDMKVFEKLQRKKVTPDHFLKIAEKLKFSKESKQLALNRLGKESDGNFSYVDEQGNKITAQKSDTSLFLVYNALNYAIYNTNPKELPEFKLKKDKLLIEEICKYTGR